MIVKYKFWSKKKPKYHHIVLGSNIEPSRVVRSKESGLKTLYDLEKWNTSVLLYSTTSPNIIRRVEIIL